MSRTLKMIFAFVAVLGAICFGIAGLLTVADVILRMFGDGIYGVVDYVQLFVVTGAFLAMPYTFAVQGHVRVELLLELLPFVVAKWFTIVSLIVTFVFTAALFWFNYHAMTEVIDRGDISMNVALPMGYYYIGLVLGLGLSTIAILMVVATTLTSGKETDNEF